MTRWPRRRDRWESAILGGTVIAVAVTILLALSAIRTRRQVHQAALASLTNYLAIALDRYANGIETAMRQSFFPIMPPPDYLGSPDRRDPLPIADMVTMIERLRHDPCRCTVDPRPSEFFRLALTTGTDLAADSTGRPLDRVDPPIAQAIREQADSLRIAGYRFGVVHTASSRGEGLVFFSARTDSVSGRRFAYGFAVPVDQIGPSVFAPTFATTRLVPRHLLGSIPRNAGFVALEVATAAGRIVYSSGPDFPDGPRDALTLPTLRGGVIIQARLNPKLKDLLIPGGVPPAIPLWELGLMGLALALWITIAVLALRAADLARLRTDFASSVTHELRTPLTQIRLAAETILLGRARDEAGERRALTSIVDETGRLQQLINNVLHYSRAERRVTTVNARRLELEPFVTDLVGAFAPIIADHHMTTRVSVPPGLSVMADPDAVRQILLNLLDNAARYGPDEQTIGVSATAAGEFVEVAVEDEGPGIAVADRERAWRPFVRLGQANGSVTGSGLGLAVARELVDAHKGRWRIEGRAGGGTRVVVSFPAGATQ